MTCGLTTAQLVDVIMAFVELYNEPAGIHLYTYQRLFLRRIITSILNSEGDVITGLWSRQSGKSESLSSLAAGLCIILPQLAKEFPDDGRLVQYRSGFCIGIFAPKVQQAGIIYERIRRRAESKASADMYAELDPTMGVATSRGDQVSWTNGSFVTAQTASEQSNVEGKTYHLVIIDEAQIVSKTKVSKEIAPMLAATNGTMVKIGTANAIRGGFKENILANLEREKKTGIRSHFEFPYDQVIREKRKAYEQTKNVFHLNYEKWVSGELTRLGGNIENEEFRQNFRLLWQEANINAIDPEVFENAAVYDLGFIESNHHGVCVAGLDYGRKRDVTVLTIMLIDTTNPVVDVRSVQRPGDTPTIYYHKTIIAWYEIPGRKWADILGEVAKIVARYNIVNLVTDATGVGDPLTEQLQGLIPSVNITPFMMSHVGNDKAYKLYIQEMEAGRIHYVANMEKATTDQNLAFQNFKNEHLQLVRDRVGVFTKCEAPEGEHDDFCDSGALANWAASLPLDVARVESTINPFYGSRLDRNRAGGLGRAARYR